MHFNHCNLEINIFTTVPVNADGLKPKLCNLQMHHTYPLWPLTLILEYKWFICQGQTTDLSSFERMLHTWIGHVVCIYKHKSVQRKLKLWVFAQVSTSALAYPLNVSQLKIHKETYIYPSIAKIILMCTMLFT